MCGDCANVQSSSGGAAPCNIESHGNAPSAPSTTNAEDSDTLGALVRREVGAIVDERPNVGRRELDE